MARKTLYLCQPYALGKKGQLVARPMTMCTSADHARRWADRHVGLSGIVGVDAVEQSADEEMGDYDAPIFLNRVGQVPPMDGS